MNEDKINTILLIGPPFSGRKEIGTYLNNSHPERFTYVHIGDLIRRAHANNELDPHEQGLLELGENIPHAKTTKLMSEELLRHKNSPKTLVISGCNCFEQISSLNKTTNILFVFSIIPTEIDCLRRFEARQHAIRTENENRFAVVGNLARFSNKFQYYQKNIDKILELISALNIGNLSVSGDKRSILKQIEAKALEIR